MKQLQLLPIQHLELTMTWVTGNLHQPVFIQCSPFALVIIAPCWYSTCTHVLFRPLCEANCHTLMLSSSGSEGLLHALA